MTWLNILIFIFIAVPLVYLGLVLWLMSMRFGSCWYNREDAWQWLEKLRLFHWVSRYWQRFRGRVRKNFKKEHPMKTVTLYTDGACSGNPGPGGWGADSPQKARPFAGDPFRFYVSPGGNEFRLGSAPPGARAVAR